MIRRRFEGEISGPDGDGYVWLTVFGQRGVTHTFNVSLGADAIGPDLLQALGLRAPPPKLKLVAAVESGDLTPSLARQR